MREPKLQDFGLTKEKYDLLIKRRLKGSKLVKSVFYVIGVILIALFFWDTSSEEDRVFYAISGGFFGGSIVGMAMAQVARFLYVRLRNRHSHEYRMLNRYEVAHKDYVDWWNRTQESFWTSLSGKQFESELALLYLKLGNKVEFPQKGIGDKGIDFTLVYQGGAKIIVQCKRHKKPVGPHIARDLYGTLINSRAQGAILASVSGFTPGAVEFVKKKRITLVSLKDIKRMVMEVEE